MQKGKQIVVIASLIVVTFMECSFNEQMKRKKYLYAKRRDKICINDMRDKAPCTGKKNK